VNQCNEPRFSVSKKKRKGCLPLCARRWENNEESLPERKAKDLGGAARRLAGYRGSGILLDVVEGRGGGCKGGGGRSQKSVRWPLRDWGNGERRYLIPNPTGKLKIRLAKSKERQRRALGVVATLQ